MIPSERHSLADIAAAGVSVPCAGNLPVDLGNPQYAWFVDSGTADLFLVETRAGVEQSAAQHVLRASAGRLLLGVLSQTGDTTLGLVAKGMPGTVLRRLPVESLASVRCAELAEQVDSWLTDVCRMLSRDVMHQSRPDSLIEPDQTLTTDNGTLSARRGVVWVSEPPAGASLFMSLIDPAQRKSKVGDAARDLPLTPVSWLTIMEPVELSACSSETLAEENRLLPALANFRSVAFSLERLNRSLEVVDDINLDKARVSLRRTDEEGARRHLFNLYDLDRDKGVGADDPALLEALRIIGRHEGIEFKWPKQQTTPDSTTLLSDILDMSGVRARRVRLEPEDRWWVGDSGAMLAFRAKDNHPVVLLPGVLGTYREVNPDDGSSARITAARAGISTHAWLFYPTLPATSVRSRDLLRLSGKGLKPNLIRYTASGLLAGLIMLLPAIVIGFIADEVIPNQETRLLYSATAALAVFAVLGALFQVFKGMALMRLEGRATSRIEAALWDRLLRLSPSFLRQYPTGELEMRGMTFQKLRDAVQGVVANAALSIIFLSPALILIFFYDPLLGGATTAFSLLSLAVTITLGLRQIAPQGRVLQATRGLSGKLFQVINGIAKLRVESAEGSAFAVWAQDYRKQKQAELELGALETHLQAFSAALPVLAGAILLLTITWSGSDKYTIGDFLVVYTVFILFQTAVARLGASFKAVAAIIPALDQIRPLLAEAPETTVDGEPVESLGGDIAFDHVSFRYDPDGPLILDDVSIRAHPGEFIAIAGESGAGKSTLFRLALGLDQPASGAVYYDGRDLKYLNVKQVRQLTGAVPQEIQLHPLDLWDNIVGGNFDATAEDVWRAARIAAIDGDIAAMPMGMLTPVGAGVSVTSGGEGQRISIAHALINKPRILLLDEATNWLDNDNQSRIMDNIATLASTRIVIAHRLSTLRQADRIYVMQAGRIVQTGTFTELVETEGIFQDLVSRQIA